MEALTDTVAPFYHNLTDQLSSIVVVMIFITYLAYTKKKRENK